MTEGREPQAKVSVASDNPFFISTIYPVVTIEEKELSLMDQIEDGYSLWGAYLPIPAGRIEYRYFTSPISYPYRFSEYGIKAIKDRLKKIEDVDPLSIREGGFPNIWPRDLRAYRSNIPHDKIVEEKFVGFKIKNWEDIEFLRFPTFLVMNIDKSVNPVKSLDDWKKMVVNWRQKIRELASNDALKKAIGISRESGDWKETPNLVFVSSPWLIWGELPPQGGKRRDPELVIREAPLLDVDPRFGPVVNGVGLDFFHEFSPVLSWRIYYCLSPWFYTGEWRHSVAPGGVSVVPGKLVQILRSVLMVHVNMPSFAEICRNLDSWLENDLVELQKDRVEFFDKFTKESIADFHSKLASKVKDYKGFADRIDRIEEIIHGYDQLLAFVKAPFRIRPTYGLEEKSDIYDAYGTELFHFLPDEDTHNDRRESERYRQVIATRLESVKKKYGRLQEEISGAHALLETRRNLLESKGVLKELDTSLKSADATLKDSDTTLKDLNKNLVKFSKETSLYSIILVSLTIVLLAVGVVVPIWQVRTAKRSSRQANWISDQADTVPGASREVSKPPTEPDTT
ncbi:MAG: hypothetical protein ABSB32_20265 [Thermodesulfobacteriota bacterium]